MCVLNEKKNTTSFVRDTRVDRHSDGHLEVFLLLLSQATTAVSINGGTRALAPRYAERGGQVAAMVSLVPGGFWVGAGGVLMVAAVAPGGGEAAGAQPPPLRVVGGVGVSGASADEDEHCALVGAQGAASLLCVSYLGSCARFNLS